MAADISGFKNYQEWRAANIAAGGDGNRAGWVAAGGDAAPGGGAPAPAGSGPAPGAPAGGAPAPASGGTTPADVRANAGKYGLPEDYARFSDAQLQDMLNRNPYNPATGKFTNNYGDQVDKPDERGPNTPANMNGTGDRGDYGSGYNNTALGNPGRGGGGRPGAAGANPAQQQTGGVDNGYLQRQLLGLAQQGAVGNGGVALGAGGTFTTGDQPPAPGIPPPGTPGAAPAVASAAAPAQPNSAYTAPPPNPVAAAVPAMQGALGSGASSPWAAFAAGAAPLAGGAAAKAATPGFAAPAPVATRPPAVKVAQPYSGKPGAWWQS